MQHITINEAVQRIQALNQFAEESGLRLPYSPGFIIGQELRGHIVDLESGSITLGGANLRRSATGRGLDATKGVE